MKSILCLCLMLTSLNVFAWGHPSEGQIEEYKERMRQCISRLATQSYLFEELISDSRSQFLLEFRLDETYWTMTGWSDRVVCVEKNPNNDAHERIRDKALNWHQPASLNISSKEFVKYLGFNPSKEYQGSCNFTCQPRN